MDRSDKSQLELLPAAIREHFDAVTAGDFERAAATLHPDATLQMYGKSFQPGFVRVALASGPYLSEMRKVFDTLGSGADARVLLRFNEVEPLGRDRFLVVGVLGTLHDRGGGSGARFGWIMTVRDDLLWMTEMFSDVAAARSAASEPMT